MSDIPKKPSQDEVNKVILETLVALLTASSEGFLSRDNFLESRRKLWNLIEKL